MRTQKEGSIVIILFIILSMALTVGLVGLSHVRRCYNVAQEQYHFYQKKYLIEGLMNYAIGLAHNEFNALRKREDAYSLRIKNWCKLKEATFDAFITIVPIKEEVVTSLQIEVELSSSQTKIQRSCIFSKEDDSFDVRSWNH